ncbi:Trace amine-associated receptor 1 [Trichoplax sp. H2]|nr:Trace amine-associated receptor 1 [Trichoplax sp. H2]|eukprot:RDD42310.1 Trace amine-associated receptor 1 [Trichoplax sp. H2]
MNVSGSISNNTFRNGTNNYDIIRTIAALATFPSLIIGCIANIFVFRIITYDRDFYKPTYYLVRISIISDTVVTLLGCVAVLVGDTVKINYALGSCFCRLFLYTILSSYSVSIFTLCIISIDRYFITLKPFSRFYLRYKRKFLTSLVLCAVLMSVTINIPVIFYVDVYPDDPGLCDFVSIDSFARAFLMTAIITMYIVPTIILLFTYGSIYWHQYNHVRPGNISERSQKDEQMKRKKFTKALITITASYLSITWPFFAIGVAIIITGKSLRDIKNENATYYILSFLSFSTTLFISVLNPFLYLKFDCNIKRKAWLYIQKYFLYKNTSKLRIIAS